MAYSGYSEVSIYSTPTFVFNFTEDVPVADISAAVFTVTFGAAVTVEKNLSAAIVNTEANSLAWTLTQAETGAFPVGASGNIICDWLLTSGTRGRSNPASCMVTTTGKKAVM